MCIMDLWIPTTKIFMMNYQFEQLHFINSVTNYYTHTICYNQLLHPLTTLHFCTFFHCLLENLFIAFSSSLAHLAQLQWSGKILSPEYFSFLCCKLTWLFFHGRCSGCSQGSE